MPQTGSAPYPTAVSVYGGPHVMYVMNHWPTRADLRAQRLAQEGYLVVKIDNRGSYRRGTFPLQLVTDTSDRQSFIGLCEPCIYLCVV